MRKIACIVLGLLFALTVSSRVLAAEKVLFSFEKDSEGWEIPDWALEKEDHVGDNVAVSTAYFNEGKASLEIKADFPGAKWTAAYTEIAEYFEWSLYSQISADVYLPADAPVGLKAKIILTVGENWEWTEMSRLKPLEPGKWTTITANLKAGSSDWRGPAITDGFRKDVRKVGIRIESNMKPAYRGSIYIDNIKVIE